MSELNNIDPDLNLVTHRASASVWDKRGWDGTRERLALTRALLGAGGAALAIQGLRQRSTTGRILAGLGGTIAWWALSGERDLTAARQCFLEMLERSPWRRDDAVTTASTESFPASDAPSWTPTVGTGIRHNRPAP